MAVRGYAKPAFAGRPGKRWDRIQARERQRSQTHKERKKNVARNQTAKAKLRTMAWSQEAAFQRFLSNNKLGEFSCRQPPKRSKKRQPLPEYRRFRLSLAEEKLFSGRKDHDGFK